MKGPCSCAIPRANGQSGFHPPCAGLTRASCPARHSPSHRFWLLIEVRTGQEHCLHSCAFCGAGGDPSICTNVSCGACLADPGDPVSNHATAVVDPPATAIECLIKVKS